MLLAALQIGGQVQTEDQQLGDPERGKQVEQRLTLKDGATVDYLLYLPQATEPGVPQPLLLFLHGRGESEGGIQAVAKWGPPMMIARGDQLPWMVVSPQCPADDRWDSDMQQARLLELLEYVRGRFPVDPARIVVTGLSLGGGGTWRLAESHPELIAAAVPVCGWGSPKAGEQLRPVPIWAWHGTDDQIIPVARSQEMVDAIRAAGGEQVRLTTLEGIGHNSWSAAYESPDLWSWMASQSRSQ